MKFGPVSPREAVGAVTAHAIRLDGILIRKAAIITEADADRLEQAGIGSIVVARLEPGDVGEDPAAERIARAVAGPHVRVDPPFTGRANLFAEAAGLLVVERAGIDAVNRLDEAVTLATLPAFRPVVEGEMVGTVKIIPFAAAAETVRRAEDFARQAAPLLRVAPWRARRVGVVSTLLPGLTEKIVAKTLRVLAERLRLSGAEIAREVRVPHAVEPLRQAVVEMNGEGHDLILVFGASAITDRRDVIPAAIEAAGGRLDHLGMPVDPGNLLLLASLDGRPVLGTPGCARSPKENGFDWVLQRLLAGLPVTRADVTGMGVGGLLMEIITRPQPRAEPAPQPQEPRVAAMVLAAGRGTRMGGPNKLLEEVAGKPLLRHAVEAALASKAAPVLVVTGHESGRVEAALAGLDVRLVPNPLYADGLSTSLKAGIAALPPEADAALVMLGDMPRVTTALIDRLVGAFDPARGVHAVVPIRDGRRGNPVLLGRRLFGELMEVSGDVGGRGLLGAHGEVVAEVEVADDAAFIDVDTPAMLAAVRAGRDAGA